MRTVAALTNNLTRGVQFSPSSINALSQELFRLLTSIEEFSGNGGYVVLNQVLKLLAVTDGGTYCLLFIGLYAVGTAYASAVMYLHVAYICAALKSRSRKSRKSLSRYPKVTIQIPVKSEPLDIIERILRLCARLRYPRDKLEVLVVSDDGPEYAAEIERLVRRISRETGLVAKFLRRPYRRGFKAGALNFATRYSSGEIVAVFDVDSVFGEDFLEKTVPYLLDGYDAVVTRWCAGNRDLTPTSRAVALAFDVIAECIQKGRAELFGTAALIGSGCLVKKSVLERLGGWCEDCIAEDGDLGLRILLSGGKLKFVDEARVYVDVPYDYGSFKKQQTRWIYGSVEILRRHAAKILTCGHLSLWQKIDNLLYYGQYLSLVLNVLFLATTIAMILAGVPYTVLFLAIQTPFIAAFCTYLAKLSVLLKKMGYGLRDSLPCLGRASAMGVAISLPGLVAFLRALLKLDYYWEVTPKKPKSTGVRPRNLQELAFGLALAAFGVVALETGYPLPALYLLVNSSPFIYVALRRNI